MSQRIVAPRNLFYAHALDGSGDFHIADGMHLRLWQSPRLGLPVVPFQVNRFRLEEINWKADKIVIKNRYGDVNVPFSLPPAATLWMSGTKAACLMELNATPSTPGSLRFQALYDTIQGLRLLEETGETPYILCFPHLKKANLIGRGTVQWIRWLDAVDLINHAVKMHSNNWHLLALPLPQGRRYQGIPNAEQEAWNRVKEGAPKRHGLDEASTPDIVSPEDEKKRIEYLASLGPANWLDRLINSIGSPWKLTQKEIIANEDNENEDNEEIGELELNLLDSLFQAALDPGIARWLGFMQTEKNHPGWQKNDIVVHVIRGVWDLDRRRLGKFYSYSVKDAIIHSIPEAPSLRGPFLELWTVACALVQKPSPVPERPSVKKREYGPWLPITPPQARREVSLHLSRIQPGARCAFYREKSPTQLVGLNQKENGYALGHLLSVQESAEYPGCGLLTDREAPESSFSYHLAQSDWFGRWSSWRKVWIAPKTRPKPPRPVATLSYEPAVYGQPVPNIPLSGTITVQVPLPLIESLSPGSWLIKQLEVHLECGTWQHTEVAAYPQDPPAFEDETYPNLTVTTSGPPLERTEEKTVKVFLFWKDTQDVLSLKSEDYFLHVFDPRPPAGCSISEDLVYTSRPDVRGIAACTLDWNITSSQQNRFRVFCTDESRLESWLDDLAQNLPVGDSRKTRASQLLQDMEGMHDRRAKANLILQNKDFLDRDLFEQLTLEPLIASGNTMRFVHELSGSLEIIYFYRIIALSKSSIEEPWEQAPLVPVVVPQDSEPAMPLVEVRPLMAEESLSLPHVSNENSTTEVDSPRFLIKITVPPGFVRAGYFRLRRSALTSLDKLRMPVVFEGPVPHQVLNPDPDQPQVFAFVDSGDSIRTPGSSLRPFYTYTWLVEVQGQEEQQGGPRGIWGSPSAPCSAAYVPPEPPDPPVRFVSDEKYSGPGVKLRWEHPEPLFSGDTGSYVFEIHRQEPGERQRFLANLNADLPEDVGGRPADRTGSFWYIDNTGEAGMRYYVLLRDPLGRTRRPAVIEIPKEKDKKP